MKPDTIGYVCIYICLSLSLYIYIYMHIHIHIYLSIYLSIYLYIYIYTPSSESVGFQSLGPGTGETKMHAPKNWNSPGILLEPFAVGLQSWANVCICICLRPENRTSKTHVFEYPYFGVGWGGGWGMLTYLVPRT